MTGFSARLGCLAGKNRPAGGLGGRGLPGQWRRAGLTIPYPRHVSTLPFRADVVEWRTLSAGLQEAIAAANATIQPAGPPADAR